MRGIAALKAGDRAAAQRYLIAALALNPRSTEALWAMGQLQRQRGNGAAAQSLLARAVRTHPFLRGVRLELGRLLTDRGLFSKARRHFSAVLDRDPQNLVALAGYARVVVELRMTDATTTTLVALRAAGHRNMVHLILARQAMLRRRWQKAHDALAKVDPSWLERDKRALVWMASVYDHLGQRRQTQRILGRLVATPNVRALAFLSLSQFSLKSGAVALALRQAERAGIALASHRAIIPVDLAVRIGLQIARCMLKKGWTVAALAELHAAAADPASTTKWATHLELATLYLSADRPRLTLRHLDRALKLRPETESAQDLLERTCEMLAFRSPLCR